MAFRAHPSPGTYVVLQVEETLLCLSPHLRLQTSHTVLQHEFLEQSPPLSGAVFVISRACTSRLLILVVNAFVRLRASYSYRCCCRIRFGKIHALLRFLGQFAVGACCGLLLHKVNFVETSEQLVLSTFVRSKTN